MNADNYPIDLFCINTENDEEIFKNDKENILIDKESKYDDLFDNDESSIMREYRKKLFFSDFSFSV